MSRRLNEAFFPPPPPAPEPEEWPTPPAWWQPPDEVGHCLPLRLLLGRSEQAAVAVTGVVRHSTGFVFQSQVLLRSPRRLDATRPRVSVEFPGGRPVWHVSEHLEELPDWDEGDPPEPVLASVEGGPSIDPAGRQYRLSWVYPLPPKGTLTFICEWPEEGIHGRGELESARILELGGER